MDLSERKIDKRRTGKKLPRIPIKTYKWEDVRRSRRRGGYPWTHLYKNSFDELDVPEDFTMEGLRKNKSSASSASDSLDIKEITEDDVKGLEDIDSSYVVIESPILLGGQIEELPNDQEVTIESAESSDNISQYLDKEERGPGQQLESTETLTLPGPSTPKILMPEELPKERAKSEEPERKRKLSIDSNYSRISLSRLGLMKKLKEAKGKIKLPKLGGSLKSEIKTKAKTEEIKPVAPKETTLKPKKIVDPVYIHIPLKPPEGESDEFSYLEFEEKRPKPVPPPDIQIEITEEKENEENTRDITDSDNKGEENQGKSSGNTLGLVAPEDQDDDVSAIIFLEGDENKGDYDIMVVDIDEKSQEMTMSQVTNTEVRRQVLDSIKRVESQAELNKSQDKNTSGGDLSRSSSKGSKTSKSSIRKRRAQSAEPEKKRRSSIDSSYSRKSLSKIGLMKKLKQFHLPFVKSESKKSIKDTSVMEKVAEPTAAPPELPKTHIHGKDQKPVYIHIPLKPPTGETDEFSHLEFETAPPPKPKIEESDSSEVKEEEKSPIESPENVQSPQFIFLTPPSDDELLEKPDIPETPSSETGSLFQFGELKMLAKKAVDQIQGNLGPVDEEAELKINGTSVVTQAVVENEPEKKAEKVMEIETEEDRITIDEEDGLKCTQKAAEEARSTMKSNLKGDASPVPKKKVSFKKRKPSQVSTDDGYEEIQAPTELIQAADGNDKKLEIEAETSFVRNVTAVPRSEQLSNPDCENVVKSTSKEEVINRWSKISDHEYEPVNPPPDEHKEFTPKYHVSDVLNSSSGPPHQYADDENLDLSIQEMQTEIENRFFNKDGSSTVQTAKKVDNSTEKLASKRSSRSRSKEKEPAKPNKFQTALKESATKFKTKFQGIKKPNISLPARPKFRKPNIKKPNIKKPNITLPSINLPKLPTSFRRTEKNNEGKKSEVCEVPMTAANPEKSGPALFSFSTYPRLFKKKKRDVDSGSLKGKTGSLERKKKDVKVKVTKTHGPPANNSDHSDTIRIPLHSRESMDQEHGLLPLTGSKQEECIVEEDRKSPRRYQNDIDTDDEQDAQQRERQEKHRMAIANASQPEESRWDRGNFFHVQNGTGHHYDDEEHEEESQEEYEEDHGQPEIVTDLDQPDETHKPFVPTRQKAKLQQNDSIDTSHSRDVGSSVSSLGQHRRGVLEEIDSDQFFLREKGISQDNIDMGRYLSTEIREAFRMPSNALADMHSYNYTEVRDSNQSLPEMKRKQIRKPKRRKTPHTSQERLRYEQESENEDYNFMPPTRPRRRSKKRMNPEDKELMPYTETISVDRTEREYPTERGDISLFYANNYRQDEHPDIGVSEPYKNMLTVQESIQRRASEPIPAAPPRKHKSLKSLNASEHESIFDEYEKDRENNNINGYANQDAFMSSQMDQTPVSAKHFEAVQEPHLPPKPPTRSRSKTKSMSRGTSQADSMFDKNESIMYDEELREPVIEEPCVQDLRDAMGYAIVDKSQLSNWEHKCCTVPRSQGKEKADAPERPLRNYSTLGPSRPPRKLSRNMTDEEKENIDITQYIEIDDDRDLQSGEVIQKMQNRPLPAPPRPPRLKAKPLNDITSEENVMAQDDTRRVEITDEEVDEDQIVETEVSTQTEPLSADFVCEEVVQEDTDKIMTPSALRKNGSPRDSTEVTETTLGSTEKSKENDVIVEKILITPTQYSYQEETITHGQLVVEPLNGAKILADIQLSRERIIPITSDEEDTSEVPETFNKLLNPEKPEETQPQNDYRQEPKKPPRSQPSRTTEDVDFFKTQKLKVSDLDVDRLTVNELVANKIIVSEIDSGNITSHEINSRSGALRLADIELEPGIIKRLLEQLQESSRHQQSILEEDISEAKHDDLQSEQKKTPIDFRVLETSTSQDSTTTITPSMRQDSITSEIYEKSKDVPQEEEINFELETICSEHHGILETEISELQTTDDGIRTLCTEPKSDELVEEKIQILDENPTILGPESQEPPVRPPRSIEKKNSTKGSEEDQPELNSEFGQSEEGAVQDNVGVGLPEDTSGFRYSEMFEPEIDDVPPPRPPQPQVPYVPSQPPSSFYAYRAQHYVEGISEDIPLVPRRKRHHRMATISRSSSSESAEVPVPRRRVRSPEPSIPQLSLQLVCACNTAARNAIKRLIDQLNSKIAANSNTGSVSSRHNVQVITVILLVLIAGLLLLGYGDGRTVHLHHWEYFNPPKDI